MEEEPQTLAGSLKSINNHLLLKITKQKLKIDILKYNLRIEPDNCLDNW